MQLVNAPGCRIYLTAEYKLIYKSINGQDIFSSYIGGLNPIYFTESSLLKQPDLN